MELKAFFENETYEFYDGGTYRDAEDVQKELKALKAQEKDIVLQFDSVRGWIVRVKKT